MTPLHQCMQLKTFFNNRQGSETWKHGTRLLSKDAHLLMSAIDTSPLANTQFKNPIYHPAIDPDNILAQAMGEEFVHTEDNEVEYYEAHKEGGRTK